jgi:glycosyltransferase involved in cell wall biosynthesis
MSEQNRHLVIISYAYQSDLNSPDELLARYFMLPSWANACRQLGIKVTVFKRFHRNQQITRQGVEYFFINDSLPPSPAYYHCAWTFNRRIQQYIKDANNDQQITLHINGLIFPVSVLQLCSGLNKTVRCVIQHHAEQPHNIRLCLLNRLLKHRINHYFFTTHSHALPWVAIKAIAAHKVAELMECSSNCQPQDKSAAKQRLGLAGKPMLLWTANLDDNKDPLTILNGFELFLTHYPEARLVMLFQHSELLAAVNHKIANSVLLRGSVDLKGKVNYQDIAAYYNAADIFVQGSAREGSGIAVLDALACGAIPVITQIPSFVALTDNGKVGALWPRAQVEPFAAMLHQVMQQNLAEQQQQCRVMFQQRWSFDVLAQQAMSVYFA